MALLALVVVGACEEYGYDSDDGVATITAEGISQYIKSLASDELEGAATFYQRGEENAGPIWRNSSRPLGWSPGMAPATCRKYPWWRSFRMPTP